LLLGANEFLTRAQVDLIGPLKIAVVLGQQFGTVSIILAPYTTD
jgi:hypothetical protein